MTRRPWNVRLERDGIVHTSIRESAIYGKAICGQQYVLPGHAEDRWHPLAHGTFDATTCLACIAEAS